MACKCEYMTCAHIIIILCSSAFFCGRLVNNNLTILAYYCAETLLWCRELTSWRQVALQRATWSGELISYEFLSFFELDPEEDCGNEDTLADARFWWDEGAFLLFASSSLLPFSTLSCEPAAATVVPFSTNLVPSPSWSSCSSRRWCWNDRLIFNAELDVEDGWSIRIFEDTNDSRSSRSVVGVADVVNVIGTLAPSLIPTDTAATTNNTETNDTGMLSAAGFSLRNKCCVAVAIISTIFTLFCRAVFSRQNNLQVTSAS